jgi:hypothetical protein
MSEIWPYDVKNNSVNLMVDDIRSIKVLLLMPFGNKNVIDPRKLKEITEKAFQNFEKKFIYGHPIIQRIDWIDSAGCIQEQIWQEILKADLIYCDITNLNPNVMFEAGICAGWKKIENVIFIKNMNIEQKNPFNIQPNRYFEYDLQDLTEFERKIEGLLNFVLIAWPDEQGSTPSIKLPLEIDFRGNFDDKRIYTPPFAHRAIFDENLQFGSITLFDHSWATIGKEKFDNFVINFQAKFVRPSQDDPKIGIGIRSQSCYASFGHNFYLKRDGSIWINQPDDNIPNFSYDRQICEKDSDFKMEYFHNFKISIDNEKIVFELDDFSSMFLLSEMEKVLGPGLIRFYSVRSLMAIKNIKLTGI